MTQARTAAAYEKMALRVNGWLEAQGYEPFACVKELSPGRYKLELLEEDGVPRVPTLEGIVEFVIGMSTGELRGEVSTVYLVDGGRQ